jgi:hypothetical protein
LTGKHSGVSDSIGETICTCTVQRIDNLEQTDTLPKQFWKEIGRISVGQERRKHLPMEIVLPDGSISRDTDTVLSGWEKSFSTMFNPYGSTQDSNNGTIPVNNSTPDSTWNEPISMMEVMTAIHIIKLLVLKSIEMSKNLGLYVETLQSLLCDWFSTKCVE